MTDTEIVESRRRPYLLFGMIAAVLVLLAAGNLIQLLLINPKAAQNQHEISHLTVDQEEFTCALAKQTADNYRNRAVAPRGGVEPVPHFRRRLFDQRRTLIAALPLHCTGVGPHFRRRVLRALHEIDNLLTLTQPTTVTISGSPAKAHAPPEAIAAAPDLGAPTADTSPSLSGGGHRHEAASSPAPKSETPSPTHPSHHPEHPHSSGAGGGGSGSPETGSPPSQEPSSPPDSGTPSETPPSTEAEPLPPKELPSPTAPIEKAAGVNVCIENPLLPLCVGVKGSSVTVE